MVTDDESCGRSLASSPEQKGAIWVKDIIQKFMLTGQTLVDTFAGTFATVRTYTVRTRNHFGGWEIDNIRFNESLLGVPKVFTRENLNEGSEIVCQADVQDVAKA